MPSLVYRVSQVLELSLRVVTVGKISASKAKSASCSVPRGNFNALKSAYGTLTYS